MTSLDICGTQISIPDFYSGIIVGMMLVVVVLAATDFLTPRK